MNFSSDAMADFEGLLEVNRKICKQQMAEKASPTLPTNCAVLPKTFIDLCMAGDSTISERLNLIRRQQKVVHAQMAQLQSTLDMLDYKEWYTAPHSKRAPAPFMRRFRRRKFPRSSVPFASEPRAQGKSKRSDTKLSAKN